MKQILTDKELYKEFEKGSIESLSQLIEKYRNNIIYFIMQYTKNRDDAEDIFQEMAVYLLQNKEKYNSQYTFKTYLYLIAKNRALNFIANKKEQINIDDVDEKLIQNNLLEEIIIDKENTKNIINSMSNLKEEYKIVIYLCQIENLSYKEAAIIMNKTTLQVKNLLFYAKKKLRETLQQKNTNHNKKFQKLLILLILLINIVGITYAIYYNRNNKVALVPYYSDKVSQKDANHVWTGIFEILLNSLKVSQKNEESINRILENNINMNNFSNKILKDNSYYIKLEYFEDKISTSAHLNRTLEFLLPFDRLPNETFGISNKAVKYFGISFNSNSELSNNIEILFYNSCDDFALKIKTKTDEEIILYRKDNLNESFEKIYEELVLESNTYNISKLIYNDIELKIPYIDFYNMANYSSSSDTIKKSILMQDISFNMNEKGCNTESTAVINISSLDDIINNTNETLELFLTNKFIVFLKDKNLELPYFALQVNDDSILECEV